MEAQKDNPPPYSLVCNGPSSYCVEYETQNNRVHITVPQEDMATQGSEHPEGVVPYQIVQGSGPRKDDLTCIAICTCFFCCCYTGIPAIVYATEAQREYGVGNVLKAEKYQKLARNWICASRVGGAIFWGCIGLTGIVFFILFISVLISVSGEYEN